MRRDARTFGTLFLSTFKLSAFTFGGGYVIIPLMRKQFVDRLGWLEEQEMLDLTAIAQSSPGPIAVNAAILLGYRVAGVPGAMVTMLGTVIPPLVILSVISLFYDAFRSNLIVSRVMKGMQAGVAAVIFDVVLTMAGQIIGRKRAIPIVTLAGAFIASWFFDVHILLILLACALIGLAQWRSDTKKGAAHDLLAAVVELFPDRPVQHRRGLCRHAADSASGGRGASVADADGVYRHRHPFANDARPHCHQLRHVCGHAHSRVSAAPLIATAGCVLPSCVIALILAWVYYRYRSLSVIQGVLGGVRPAVVAMIASAGLSILLLGALRQRSHQPSLVGPESAGHLRAGAGGASHLQTRSHLGNGRGRRAGRHPVLAIGSQRNIRSSSSYFSWVMSASCLVFSRRTT